MNWMLLIMSVILMALIASFMVFVTNRGKRNPRYDELKHERAALLFTFYFIVFWILLVPREGIEAVLGRWERFVLPICFTLIYFVARRMFKLIYHSEENVASLPGYDT